MATNPQAYSFGTEIQELYDQRHHPGGMSGMNPPSAAASAGMPSMAYGAPQMSGAGWPMAAAPSMGIQGSAGMYDAMGNQMPATGAMGGPGLYDPSAVPAGMQPANAMYNAMPRMPTQMPAQYGYFPSQAAQDPYAMQSTMMMMKQQQQQPQLAPPPSAQGVAQSSQQAMMMMQLQQQYGFADAVAQPMLAAAPQPRPRRRSSSISSNESQGEYDVGQGNLQGQLLQRGPGGSALLATMQSQYQQLQHPQQMQPMAPMAQAMYSVGMQAQHFATSNTAPAPQPAGEGIEVAVKRKEKKRRTKTFPEKLLSSMMDNAEDEDAVAWLPDGKSFVVVNADLFVQQVLRPHFKECKYASFVRKLHRWGFVRLTSGTGTDCFHHPFFQKGRKDLAAKINCTPREKDMSMKGAGKPPSLAGVEKFIRAKAAAAAAAASTGTGGDRPHASEDGPTALPSVRDVDRADDRSDDDLSDDGSHASEQGGAGAESMQAPAVYS